MWCEEPDMLFNSRWSLYTVHKVLWKLWLTLEQGCYLLQDVEFKRRYELETTGKNMRSVAVRMEERRGV
jgi:hypothetical protein